MAAEPIILAEGIEAYLAATRRAPGPMPSLETLRLSADRDAHRIAYARPPGMRVIDIHAVGAALETPVRIYRPAGEGAQPAILYFHGGGFTTGSIESYDCLATALAEASGATVVSIQYARLPESTPDAMVAQCHDALCWTQRMSATLEIDPDCIAVAGDSAGAFLATHVALRARDAAEAMPCCQLLCYGVYDLDPDRAAYRASRDPVLVRPVIDGMIAAYRDADARSSKPVPPPLQIADLSGLSPAVMLGAAHDAVLAEGHEYAARLRDAGVEVIARVAPDMCHGFLRAVRFSAPARDEMRWLGDTFRTLVKQG